MHLITIRHTHTHTHTHTLRRALLDDGSAFRRDLYLTTSNIHKETDIHDPGGIRTRIPSKRAVGDTHLRRRGHWVLPTQILRTSYPRVSYTSIRTLSHRSFFVILSTLYPDTYLLTYSMEQSPS